MFFFNRKKKEAETPEETPKPRRRIRDLNPENRRKRQEPLKPWGRKERFLVLGVLGITVVLSGLLAAQSRDWKLPYLPRLSQPKIAASEKPQTRSTSISEKKKTNSTTPEYVDDVRSKKAIDAFQQLTNSLSGVYGFCVLRLESNEIYGVSEREVFDSASLIKLPIMATAYISAEQGTLDLNAIYTLMDDDKVGGSGSLSDMPEGSQYTYQQLADLMGKQSDNTAFKIMKATLGPEKIDLVMRQIGMDATDLDQYETSPYDVSLLFQKIWTGNLLNTDNKEKFLDSLTNTIYENWLTKDLPDDVRVAHKYGRDVHIVNDGGIIYAKKPFVLVIMSKGVVDSEADTHFSELARAIYAAEEN